MCMGFNCVGIIFVHSIEYENNISNENFQIYMWYKMIDGYDHAVSVGTLNYCLLQLP